MKMLVTDHEVDLVRLALAKEMHERSEVFQRLCRQGHVIVLQENDPVTIRCRVGDELFECERNCFPSIELMARVQLAVHAGLTCRGMAQAIRGPEIHTWWIDEVAAVTQQNIGQMITATVKTRPQRQKGLRP